VDVPIGEGEIFLLPPTCRIRRAVPPTQWGWSSNAIGRAGELDGFQWYCENCGHRLYEEFIAVTNIETQLPPRVRPVLRQPRAPHLRQCGTVMERPK
jgi:3-hydroxyanthranilate 3,4-dioxygenase